MIKHCLAKMRRKGKPIPQSFYILLCLLVFSLSAKAQEQQITGKILFADKEPVIGANVMVEGTTKGTVTDAEGTFTFNVPAKGTLAVSYLGYRTQKVKIDNRKVYQIVLEEDAIGLEDVVVVGFGTQKKVNLTGAISSVSSAVLESKPIANLGQALEGVVPNLNISGINSDPNSMPTFNVRGGTSMSYNNDDKKWQINNGSPLILIDGIQIDNEQLSMMNPNDIENISVLKDAAASAIYGARASYGVMLITTKGGGYNQKPKVDYNFNIQWNTPTHLPEPMDAYTHQLASMQAQELTGGTVTSWDKKMLAGIKNYIDNPVPENAWILKEGSTKDFAWVASIDAVDLAVKDWAPMQKHAINVSGGSAKTRYYISLGYQRQEGMYKTSTDVSNRYNGMVNLDTEITNWFKVGTKLSYNSTQYDTPYLNPQKGGFWSAIVNDISRNLRAPVKTGPNDPIPNTYTDNVVGWMGYGATKETSRQDMMFTLLPVITISPELKIQAELSYKPNEYFQKKVTPTREYVLDSWNNTITSLTDPSSVEKWGYHSDLYTVNAYATFNKAIKKHYLGGVIGFNQEWYKYRDLSGTGQNILTPSLPVISGTTGKQYASDAEEEWAVRGAFLRLNYSYNDRYLVEFNGRYDGTSRFGKESRYKFFPSVSAGWRISEEQFLKPAHTWLDNLKVRGSWGTLGNQEVATYAYIPQYGSVSFVNYSMGGSRPMGINPPGLISPDLTWETAATLDFGVDFTLLNKLDATFDWYTRKTTDILMDGGKLPAVLGSTAPRANSGVLRTNGWELSLKWRDGLSNGLKYEVGFILSDYITEVEKFTGNPNKLLTSLYDGMRMGEIWGYETEGILQKEDFTIDENGKYILNGPSQTKLGSVWWPGDIRYKDTGGKTEKIMDGDVERLVSVGSDGEVSSGDNTVYNPGDRKVIGNNSARFRYGITGNVSWKNIDLNIFFQGIAKRDVWLGDGAYLGALTTSGNMDRYLNSWTPERTDAKYPMYAGRGQNNNTQTGYLMNGAYLRLKTLSLGYTLPKSMLKKIYLSNVRVNISGYNLFEITQIPDRFDPDVLTSSYPAMRSVAFGLQVGF